MLLPEGEALCLDQVKAGMAWHYKQYQDEQIPADREAYGAAECAAMKGKVGLRGDPHLVQPPDRTGSRCRRCCRTRAFFKSRPTRATDDPMPRRRWVIPSQPLSESRFHCEPWYFWFLPSHPRVYFLSDVDCSWKT